MASEFEQGQEESSQIVPSFLVAANNHNIANNNWSWWDTATKGTAGVIASAAAQIADIAPTIGNMLGGDYEHIKTQDLLQSFDDDYTKYYKEHQQGIDALGFAVGSIVPGTAGVKVGKAGATMLRTAVAEGKFGANLAEATKLLAPSQPKVLAEAVQKALQPNAGFPIWNSKTYQAIAMGAGESFLEGVAFETAVAATMYNSPVLKDQSIGDLVSNVAHGGLLFGAIGGVARGAGTYFKIKNAEKELSKFAAENRWNIVPELGEAASPSNRIIAYLDDLASTPKVDAAAFTGEEAWKGTKFQSMYDDKTRYVQTKVRGLIGEMTGKDKELGDTLYETILKLDSETAAAKLFGVEQYSRLSKVTEYEKQLHKLQKNAVELVGEEVESLLTKLPSKSLTYVKLAGEGAGKVFAEAPTVVGIADRLKAGESYMDAVYSSRQGLAKNWSAFETTPEIAEARYVTAARHTFKPSEVIGWDDIPYLQSAYNKFGTIGEVSVKRADGSITKFSDSKDLFEHIKATKEQIAEELIQTGKSPELAAKLTDMKLSYVAEGKASADVAGDIILTRTGDEFASPQWAKVVHDTTQVSKLDNNTITAMVAIKQQEALYMEAAERAAAPVLENAVSAFPELRMKYIYSANRSSVGGGFLSYQNENYGTLGSLSQYIGRQTIGLIDKACNATRTAMEPALYKLAQKQEAAIEWSVLNARLRAIPESYVFRAETSEFIPAKLAKYEAAVARGENVSEPIFADTIPLSIPVRHAETAEVVALHIGKNGERSSKLGTIRTNQGVKWSRDPDTFYPIPANPKDYPHFAYVVDNTITGAGRSKLLTAADSATLESMITEVKAGNSSLKILTKKDAEDWYKAVGQFEWERTLTDVAYDASALRAGKSAQYLPPTDPQKITSDILNWHLQRDTNLVREAVSHIYEPQIKTLRAMGENFSNVNTSHYTNLDPVSYVEMIKDNPFANYVKTMLGLSTAKEFPFWSPVNDMLDRRFSALFSTVREGVKQVRNPADLEKINAAMRDAGYEGAYYSAALNLHANHTAPRGALTAFVGKANSILSSLMLGWDPINAVNNIVGANVLRNTELKSLLRAIGKADKNAAGELSELSTVKLPGTGDPVFSPAKMIAKAMGDFTTDSGKELRALFRERGIISDRVEQMKWVIDNLALTGKESVGQMEGKVASSLAAAKKLLESGDKITGNKLAEEFNRFVSGHVVKQITDRAVKAGVIGEAEAWAYINTFVNRVEGNYIAAQRPGVFQGPLGQAMGLFQTYQFNLMQQLFRHVGEGTAKDTGMLLGLQSAIYGIKGTPAFDAINTHIVGTASGNKEHTDLYSTVYGAAGKDAGNWLMYGMSSNALGILHPDLKFNLYSRGDINPRNVTLLPLNPANLPIVQAAGKMFSSMKETYSKVNAGGDVWGSMLQGIEHAGVNRPLAGLAQSLQAFGNPQMRGYSTSSRGNVIATNDLVSLSSFVRIAGAKPLDEAIALDRMYNIQTYAAYDKEKRNLLGEAVKTTVIGGKTPSAEQLNSFAAKYAATGGRQEHFSQWMMQLYKSANTSQINELTHNLNNPFARGMQRIMGGYDMNDFVYGAGS